MFAKFGLTLAFAGLGIWGCSADDSTDQVALDEEALGRKVEVCFRDKTELHSASSIDGLVKQGAYRGPCDLVENRTSLGDGYLQTFVHLHGDGRLRAMGVQIDQKAVDTLPMDPVNDGNTCWDLNEDGTTDPHTECSGGHERVLFFPKMPDVPITWIMFNWQAHGHAPAHVFDKPHFDLHYFIQDYVDRNFIRLGPCATQANCDDFDKAMIDIPAPFFPVGFENVGGVAGRMGNHLVNKSAAPFHGEPMTQAFAYGQYNGHLSFYEPVVSTAWLQTRPIECDEIPPPPEMEVSGWYPNKYCTRYRRDRKDYIMTLEDFEFREAPAQ